MELDSTGVDIVPRVGTGTTSQCPVWKVGGVRGDYPRNKGWVLIPTPGEKTGGTHTYYKVYYDKIYNKRGTRITSEKVTYFDMDRGDYVEMPDFSHLTDLSKIKYRRLNVKNCGGYRRPAWDTGMDSYRKDKR